MLRDRAFVRLLALNFTFVISSVALINSMFPVFARNQGRVSEDTIGLLFLLNAILIIAAQLPVAKAIEGHRRARGLAIMCLLFAAAWTLVELAGLTPALAIALLLAGIACLSIGECLYDSIYGPLVADLAPEGTTGRYMAASGVTWQFGFITAAAVGGTILGAEPLALWPLIAAVALAAGAYSLRFESSLAPATRWTPRREPPQLVAIDSVNPTLVPGGTGEQEIARFVANWLERARLDVELQEAAPGRPNVIATVRGRSSGRSLVLNAHTDTVGLGGPDAALQPRIDDCRLYGRGAYDMKGSLAAIMLAGAAIADTPLAGDLIITAVADEEARSAGTEALLHNLHADAAIVAEPTDLLLAIAHKGFLWLEVETEGRAAHGSRYDLGIDAIFRMAHVLASLEALDQSLRSDRAPHSLLGGASLHTSLIEGGQELSSYPERCLLKLERRTMPGETADAVEQQIAAAAGAGVSVRRLFAREPLETSSAEPIVTALRTSAEQLLDAAPQLVGVPFWTDAALFAAAGIPSILFGPRGEGAHAETEWVDLGDVARCASVFAATARAFCQEAADGTGA